MAVCIMCLMLFACQTRYSDDYLLAHPAVLMAQWYHCRKGTEKDCARMAGLVGEMRQKAQKALGQPTYYGEPIMHAQRDLVRARTRLKSFKTGQKQDQQAQLRSKIQKLEKFIKRRLAVVRFLFISGRR